MYLNKVILIGNLTRDPELRSLPSGAKLTTFGIATNRYWKDRTTGEKKEASEFHNISVFGPQADACSQYLTKGQQVMIEGRITTRSWDDKDGNKQYRTEIVAESVQFGQRAGGAGSQGQGTSEKPQDASKKGDTSPSTESDTIEYPDDEANADDIPF